MNAIATASSLPLQFRTSLQSKCAAMQDRMRNKLMQHVELACRKLVQKELEVGKDAIVEVEQSLDLLKGQFILEPTDQQSIVPS